MKRSEVIKTLVDMFKSDAPIGCNTEETAAEHILKTLENLGMLPPPRPLGPVARVKRVCVWEPES